MSLHICCHNAERLLRVLFECLFCGLFSAGGINPMLLNQLMMQGGGAPGGLGLGAGPLGMPMNVGPGRMEPPSKMLRLDEGGVFFVLSIMLCFSCKHWIHITVFD